MATSLGIQELAKVVRVDEVAVDGHGHTVGAVDVKGLGLGPGSLLVGTRSERDDE